MQYHQPFDQPNNPNASYVNADPSNGIAGSIPPAAQMEYPQREIVAVIAAAGLTPSDTDLAQLLRAVRGGQLSTFTDQSGAANTITLTPALAHASFVKGLPFRIFPANTNTSASVSVQVNTLTCALKRRDGSNPAIGDIQAGVPIDVVSDGTNLRLVGFAPSDIAALIASANPAAGYVQIGDQNYGTGSTDTVIATSAAFTAPRTITLPAASSRAAGSTLVFLDRVGAVSAANTLTFATAGSDTLDGAASFALGAAYQIVTLRSDGASRWTYDRKPELAFRAAGDANASILASDGTVATSAALTAPRTWTLPAANSVRPGKTVLLTDLFGACGSTNTVTLARSGSDTINGATSLTLTAAFFQLTAISDGVSRWAIQYVDLVQIQNLLTSATSGLEKGWRIVEYTVATSSGMTITATDHQRVQVDVTNGPATINLPNTPAANVQIDVYRKGTSTYALTVTTAGGSPVFAFNDGSTDTGIIMGSDTPLNIIGLYADGSVYRCNPGIVV